MTLEARRTEEVVRRFFDVMNEHDAAAVDALFSDSAELVMGLHVARGLAEIREIALQDPPELVITSEPTSVDAADDRAVVAFRRRQAWRDADEPALEEQLWATFELDGGLIVRAELHRTLPAA